MELQSFFTALAALCFTLALIVGAAIILRRVNPTFNLPTRNRRLTRVESLPLTPHHTLHIVKVDNEELVITTTPQSATILITNTQPNVASSPKNGAQSPQPQNPQANRKTTY